MQSVSVGAMAWGMQVRVVEMFGGAKPAGTSRPAEMLWMKTGKYRNMCDAT